MSTVLEMCKFCGGPSTYNGEGWMMMHSIYHCEKRECIAQCLECRDDFEAIGGPDADAMPNEIIVELTKEEIEIAESHGAARQNYGERAGLKHSETMDPARGMDCHKIGNVCEYAAHKGLKKIGIDVPYNPSVGNTNNIDLKYYEVRGNTTVWGRLRVNRGSEKPNKPWIHVIDKRPTFILAGWAWGREITIDKYWGKHGFRLPCWGMPREDLHPMSAIPRFPERR